MFSPKKTVLETDTTEKSFLNQYKLRRQYQTMTIGFVMVSAVMVFLLLVVTENPVVVALIGKSFFDRPVVEKITEKILVATPMQAPTAVPTLRPEGITKYLDSSIDDQFQMLTEVGAHGEYNLAQLVDKETRTNVFDGPLPLQAKWIQSFYFDQDQKALYVIEGTGPYGESYSEFSKIKFDHDQYAKKVFLVKKSSYKQETRIQKIYSDDNIALTTYSADGCSGAGDISLLENGVERVITRWGSGSEDPQLPRLVGFSNDRWYLYRVADQPIDPQGEVGCSNYPALEVFSLGVDSQDPVQVIGQADMPKDVSFIRLSKGDPTVLMLLTSDEKLYQYDFSTKKLTLSDQDPSTFFVITEP